MKKVFFIVAAVFLGTFAHAASIVWGSGNPMATVTASPSGGTLSNYVAYLCVGGDSVAQSTLSDVRNGTWKPSSVFTSLNGKGIVTQTTSVLDALLTPGTVYDFFVVIFDEARKNVMISSVLEGTPYDETGTDPASKVVWTQDQLKGTTDWTTTSSESEPSVPEPTALALLALGVAGLALRRRMA